MFYNKNLMMLLAFTTSMYVTVFSVGTDNFGFYTNLSDDEKMYLIVGALDEGLYQMFVTFQNDQDAELLCASLSVGLEKNKAIFSALKINMHPNVMYLTFLENAYFLCKYGKTGQFLATLSSEERSVIFNICYNCWVTDYINQLNLNLANMLDDLDEHFAAL